MNVTAQVGDTLFQASGAAPLDPQSAKSGLRAEAKRKRKNLAPSVRSGAATAVARLALRCPQLRFARRVAVYLSIGSELSTAPLIDALRARGITVFAPAIRRGAMGFRKLDSSRLERHPLGMRQPRYGIAWRASVMDVVILPLLGFDSEGNRLGQGGGYYDRALARSRFRPYRLGLAFACQQLGQLPQESWDQPLHAVLTERGLRRFPRKLTG